MASSRLVLLRTMLGSVRRPVVSSARVPPVTQHLSPHVVVAAPCYARHYATKKSKAKAKSQTAKVSINAALVEDIISLDEVKEEMTAALATLKDDFSRNLSIRTSPGALDHITVNTKDGKFPLNQLGQISMKSPQLIVINMASYPEATASATRALQESSMKLNPEVEGTIIRVPIPKVTREHRENLAKLAKQFSNKAKESVRRVRSNALAQVQQMADAFAADVDKQLASKTKELLG
ncbi:ribosome-recycling factor, mitochondrial isoform X2 [Tachysurus fulvidraco]|uniref:ribosome-recycling factor, mitochondrial isoform X2 n=1 Tax=Tachysurus fulvidraco TaxID=1234273 RepID=UPI000F502DF4|nr:ribosome-recycling factor, mitochondrial isoform X2 [Tachysurus fulvidraco]